MNYIPPHFDAAQLTILLRPLLAFSSFPCEVFPHVVFFPPSRATSVESLLAPVCLLLLPPDELSYSPIGPKDFYFPGLWPLFPD